MGFVGNYAPRGLSPQTDGMPVILKKGWSIEPSFFLEDHSPDHTDQNTYKDDYRVSIAPGVLRHLQIHTVPAGDQGQRHENRCDNGQQGDDFVLPLPKLGLYQIPYLDHIVAQGGNGILKPHDSFGEQAEKILEVYPT